jgi:hypothetical protein
MNRGDVMTLKVAQAAYGDKVAELMETETVRKHEANVGVVLPYNPKNSQID